MAADATGTADTGLGRIAYEAEAAWLDEISPGSSAPWDDLDPEHRGVYQRVAGAVAAAERGRIRPLVTQWRAAAKHLESSNALWSSHFYDCANELERLLGEPGQPAGEEP